MRSWRQVFRSLHNSVKRRFIWANFAIAEPYMLSTVVHFIVELMIYAQFESCHVVYLNHFFNEVRPMAINAVVPFVFRLCKKQPCMYHLMQQCLQQVVH